MRQPGASGTPPPRSPEIVLQQNSARLFRVTDNADLRVRREVHEQPVVRADRADLAFRTGLQPRANVDVGPCRRGPAGPPRILLLADEHDLPARGLSGPEEPAIRQKLRVARPEQRYEE